MTIVQSVQDAGPCRKQVTVTIPAPAVEKEQAQVLRDLGHQVSIPGFRKGKIPPKILRQRFGDRIDKEVVDRLLPRFWEEAQAEIELQPLLPPQVEDVGELAHGEPLTFVATVEIRPEIELGEISEFDLPDPEVEPTEDEIRESLDDLRRRVADWVPVDREAARGDMVAAEITEIPETPPEEEAEPEPQTLEIEVGDPQVWEELSLAVTGLSPGQEGRFSHRDPPPQEGPMPPERHFRVSVVAVKERELPPLDDDFARTVGDFEDLAELEGRVRERVTAHKKGERDQARRDALIRELRARYPVELPRGVVDQEVERLVNDYARSLAQQGVDLENADIDWRKIAEQARPQAEERVHTQLLLDAVAREKDIEVEPGELEEALSALARGRNTSVPAMRKELEDADRLESFRVEVRRNKVVRHLMGEGDSREDLDTAQRDTGQEEE
jgi:trigger factor